MIKTITQWLTEGDNKELPALSVAQQTAQLDKVGTGIGWVWVLTPVESETSQVGDGPVAAVENGPEQELHMTSQAIFKIRGAWYVAVDDNISDIACAVVRMIMQNLPAQ